MQGPNHFSSGLPGKPSEDYPRENCTKWSVCHAHQSLDIDVSGHRPVRPSRRLRAALRELQRRPGRGSKNAAWTRRRTLRRTDRLLPRPGLLRNDAPLLRQRLGRLLRPSGKGRGLLEQCRQSLSKALSAGIAGILAMRLLQFHRSSATDPGSSHPRAHPHARAASPLAAHQTRAKQRRCAVLVATRNVPPLVSCFPAPPSNGEITISSDDHSGVGPTEA
jgi:hypothetical protein